jgi:ADP-ribosylglycohydrolase
VSFNSTASDRARGALYGLAIGDALGMPTQLLSREQIVSRYGRLTGFEPAPPDHPIAAGQPAGAVTDDTEQAVLLGRLLTHGPIDPRELAAALVAWEASMAERGSLDLLGPSTKRAVAAVLAGTDPAEAGRYGDTNGAAMRIAPVGIATRAPGLVDAVVAASSVTHNTGIALAGAAAVAAVVSAGIDGATFSEALPLALTAAREAARRGYWVAGADVAARIEWAVSLVGGLTETVPAETVPAETVSAETVPAETAASELIYTLVGTSLATQESVPAAFAVLAAIPGEPWRACLAAASLGGDCDTIAAMAGAMAGATCGVEAFPAEAIAVIDKQGFGLDRLADELYRIRDHN